MTRRRFEEGGCFCVLDACSVVSDDDFADAWAQEVLLEGNVNVGGVGVKAVCFLCNVVSVTYTS
jgi:hypothetical protein